MTNSRCNPALRLLLVFGVMILTATSWAQQRPPIVEKLANTYGLESYGQIEAIRYTFNLNIPGLINLSRTWTWEPKTGQVTYEGKDKDGKPVKVTYLRSQLSSQPDAVKNEIDPGFTNDNYWLIFPFHVYWDTGATVTDEAMQKLPLGKGSAEKVVVKYPSDVGYTPGDTWTLYVGADGRVEEFRYDRGGPKKAQCCDRNVGGLQKGRPSAHLDGAPRHRRRQAAAPLVLECGRQAGGLRQVDGREIGG